MNDRFAEALSARLNGQYQALLAQGGPCSPALARQANVEEPVIAAAAAEALGLSCLEQLDALPVSHEFLTIVPIAYARRHRMIGLAGSDGTMRLAICDLAAMSKVQTLGRLLGRRVEPVFAGSDQILRTINAAYQQQTGQAQRVIEEMDRDSVLGEIERAGSNEDLLDVASRAPVIKLVNLILFEAVKRRASDVHVQPYEDSLVVRLRVDDILHDVFKPPKALQEEIISRIKVMGGMNIAERRLPLDGRATVEVGDRVIDLRIATLPTCFGERAVIRLLDKSARQYDLGELGMPPVTLGIFRQLIIKDHGIILVTGPTGSGKSTTLYSALQEINSQELNIVTLEDPIEYQLPGISQTQVSERKGMTFAGGLRHVLRQDPDIIMIGEIRDGETARMAIQSALTGHLVFTTLHTNDAAGAVARMLDLGVEPYLLASCLLASLAQRLVRRICPQCQQEYQPSAAQLRHWGIAEDDGRFGRLYRGQGCPACLDSGYRERVGIFELLPVSEPIRELILQRAKASTIKAAAMSEGMTTLRSDGVAKAISGGTTMDEVCRVTSLDDF